MWFGAPEGMNCGAILEQMSFIDWQKFPRGEGCPKAGWVYFWSLGCVGRGWVPFGTKALTGQENHSTPKLIHILIVGGKRHPCNDL